jgi:endonuclease/exonuclease/phosphatase family metal-dependent hydrolase
MNQHKFGIATYSSLPIVNKEVVVFNDSYNCAIYSDIKVGTDTIRVFNVHLQSFRLKPSDYQFIDSISTLNEEQRVKGALGVYERMRIANSKRATQAEIIAQKVAESPYPVILSGDFNDAPSSYSYAILSEKLLDSHLQNRTGIGGTFPRFIPSFRIDYLLYQPPVQCHSYMVFKNNFSDHYPIMGLYSVADKTKKQAAKQN